MILPTELHLDTVKVKQHPKYLSQAILFKS